MSETRIYTPDLSEAFKGRCDREGCDDPVTSVATNRDGSKEKLCSRHNQEEVGASNLATYRRQKTERETVSMTTRHDTVLIMAITYLTHIGN